MKKSIGCTSRNNASFLVDWEELRLSLRQPRELGLIWNMFPYSFNYLKFFLKTDFVLCDTNTSLCSFNNNLNSINYMFILIFGNICHQFNLKPGCAGNCVISSKYWKRWFRLLFLNQIFVCFVEELVQCLVYREDAQCVWWPHHFRTEESNVTHFPFLLLVSFGKTTRVEWVLR